MYEIPAAYRENEIRVKRQLSDLSLSRPQISSGRELSQYEISIIWKDWHLQYSYKMFVGMKVKHIMVCFKSYKSSWDNYFPRTVALFLKTQAYKIFFVFTLTLSVHVLKTSGDLQESSTVTKLRHAGNEVRQSRLPTAL